MSEHAPVFGASPAGSGGVDDAADAAHTRQKIELLVQTRQYAGAAALAGAYLAAHPDDPDVLVSLGEAHAGLGRGADAVASYRRALAAAPHHYKAACCLAFELKRGRRLDEALHTARTLVRLHPDIWGSHLTLASVAVACPNPALRGEAYAAALRAVELEPGEPECHVVLGLAARGLGDHETARRANAEALRLDPENAAALNNRGTVMKRFQRGAWGEQIETYARSAALEPDDVVSRYNLEVTVYNTLNRTGWLAIGTILIAIVTSVASGARGGGVAGPGFAVAAIGTLLVAAVWVGWAAVVWRRIPRGRHRMLARVAAASGPVRAIAASTAVLAAATVLANPLSLVAPEVSMILIPLLLAHRIVELSSLSALRRRHPDRLPR